MMKKVLGVMIAIIGFASHLVAADGVPQSDAFATDLEGGWKSGDPGAHGLIWDIAFWDASNGWLCGIRSVSRTCNGGRSWKSCWNVEETFWFNSVAPLDPDSAMVAGMPYGRKGPGKLLMTRDGGTSWQVALSGASDSEQFSSIRFLKGAKTGFVLSTSRGLLRSDDGGATWRPNTTPLPKTPHFWLATRHIIGTLGDSFVYAAAGPCAIAFSEDAGKSWRTVELPQDAKNPQEQITRAHFGSSSRGWVTFDGGETVETLDGGATWTQSKAPGIVFLQDALNGWAISDVDIFQTKDGGRTWGEPLRIGDSAHHALVAMTAFDGKAYVVGGREGTGDSFFASFNPSAEADSEPKGIVPIEFQMPADGFATIQLIDKDGQVVQNVVAGQHFKAGANKVYWDLGTLDEFWPPFRKSRPFLWEPPAEARKIAQPGVYRWRGIWLQGLDLEYRYTFCPLLRDGVAWLSEDKRGGWLADHEAPRTIVNDGSSMWIGAFNEEGDAVIQTDFEMRKQWGSPRVQLACPKILAADKGFVYFLAQGGWLSSAKQSLAFIQIDPKTHSTKRLFAAGDEEIKLADSGSFTGTFSKDVLKGGKLGSVEGLLVIGRKAFIADRTGNRILVADITENLAGKNETMKTVSEIPIESPAGMRLGKDGRIAAISGRSLVLIDLGSGRATALVDKGLLNPLSLAIDANGNFYVSELEPLHQVKVFDKAGKPLRVIGKPGGHPIGKFDPDYMESPTGIEIDNAGNLWVCENNYDLKRVSVWSLDGHCTKQVMGPTEYGGGGSIDPDDANRAFLAGKEYRHNPKTGKVSLEKILWRFDDKRYDSFVERRPHNFNGPSPEYPFRHGGKLFFSLWGGHGMGEISVLWVYAGNELKPVAAVGRPPKWLKERLGAAAADAKAFAWTDRNDDGRVQVEETALSPFDLGSAQWGVRMNQDFKIAFSSYDGPVGISFCEVAELTDKGYPVYKLPAEFKMAGFKTWDPNQVQNVYTDRKGNAVAISPYIFSMAPDGKMNWRYVCRWPGLHAGRSTTGYGHEPGVLISPLRCYGSVVADPEIGEILCFGTDYGATHFMTADGLYVGRGFSDARRGNAWTFNAPPDSRQLSGSTLDGEHFGGSFQAATGEDGKQHFLYVVAPGGPTAVVVEQKGLDKINRLKGGKITVSPKDLKQAVELRAWRAIDSKVGSMVYQVKKPTSLKTDGMPSAWPSAREDGISLAYDEKYLYVFFDGSDDRAPFKNAAGDDEWKDAFRKGDTIDIFLGTDKKQDPKRQKAAQGDLRLCLVPFGDNVKAILYDYVAPSAEKPERVDFASPWWTTSIDRICIIQDTKCILQRRNGAFKLEAAIPLAALHLDPIHNPLVKGDFGRCLSEQSGTRTVDRKYWSDNSNLMMNDISIESRINPAMWGELKFVGDDEGSKK